MRDAGEGADEEPVVHVLAAGGEAYVVADERPKRDEDDERGCGAGLEALLEGAAPPAAQHRHGGLEDAAAAVAGVAAGADWGADRGSVR